MNPAPVIIRRRKRASHAHHGGAWKIAFADFMTALMALFLVLWVLSSASKAQRNAIAGYFSTPLLSAIGRGDRTAVSASVIPGGGPSPTFRDGELSQVDTRVTHPTADESRRLDRLRERLRVAIEQNVALKDLRQQVLIERTPEGLSLQLIDSDQRPMFEVGSARLAPYMSSLLRTIAPVLNELPNSIQISGHTDSHPYAGGEVGYSNWELSADRAKASRQELVSGGLDPDKLLRISGMSDRIRFRGAQPNDAVNRRIAIVVLDDNVTARILSQSEAVPAPRHAPIGP